jgi:hypothetical protein
MTAFETLIQELSSQMDIPLKVDVHQSCRLEFPQGIAVQIDLDNSGERVLLGSELGRSPPGVYRERLLRQALIVNGWTALERGTLAYSEKNGTFVLFSYLPLAHLNGASLFHFLQAFVEHATIWSAALLRGEIPQLEEKT